MKHVAQLDGLRAIAVTAVVLFHASSNSPIAGGFLGVDMFFVLSGFLITRILAREYAATGTIALGQFYLRRLMRLMPALVLLLAFYLVFAPTIWPQYGSGPHLRDAAITATYLSDYAYAGWSLPTYLRHTWSLSVEEHFYLIWPIVLPAVLGLRNPVRCMAVLFVAASAWRMAEFADLGWQQAYYRFDTRLSGLVAGGWLALAMGQNSAWQFGRHLSPSVMTKAAVALIASMFVLQQWRLSSAMYLTTPMVELATAILINAVVASTTQPHALAPRLSAWLGSAPLVWIGKLSYGIYLWHFPISLLTRDQLPFWLSAAFCMAGGTAIAWISYQTVERFGRHWRSASQRGTAVA